MSFRELVLLPILVHISMLQLVGALQFPREHSGEAYRLLKSSVFGRSRSIPIERTLKPSIKPEESTQTLGHPCASNPCAHEGICIPKGQLVYECKCVGPWHGINCNVVDACYRSSCRNNGTCLNVGNDYWCNCTRGYYGKNCQTKFYSSSPLIDHCRPNTCKSGRCVSLSTTYYCQCPNNRLGQHCERRVYKRSVAWIRSYHDALHHIRRSMIKYDSKSMQQIRDDPRLAYYDPQNGIYF